VWFGLLDSRSTTRALIVLGALGLTAVRQLDRAAKTAYESSWAASSGGLRLPTHWWVATHAAAGLISIACLAAAAMLWRGRDVRSGQLAKTSWVLAGTGVVLALGAALARVVGAEGSGKSWLTVAFSLDVVSLLSVIALALVTGNLVYLSDDGVMQVVKRVLQRQRMNVLLVVALAAGLMFVGNTSGQAVDSMRSWSPIVFTADGPWAWSTTGAARLALGLASALLLALAIYESGVRLVQVKARMDEPPHSRRLAALGMGATLVGAISWWLLPMGPGILLAGLLILLVAALDKPEIAALDKPGLEGKEPLEATPSRAEHNAPEWLALVPLLALGAISIAASIETALSAGIDGNVLVSGLPALLVGVLAVVMTRRTTAPTLIPVKRAVFIAIVLVTALASVVLLVVGRTGPAGVVGLIWLGILSVYAWILFRGVPEHRSQPAFTVPIVLGGALSTWIGIHVDPIDTGHLLGVIPVACLALAFAVLFFRRAVDATLRLRPPKLLWWFGLTQLPVLTLVIIWWIAVGVLQTQVGPKNLHDVRLVERAGPAVPGQATPRLEDAFDEWVAAQPDLAEPGEGEPVPLVLVASHGGGIRAAYWTVAALDCIVGVSAAGVDPPDLGSDGSSVCDSTRRTPEEQRWAARRIFMASGVSGGAVGLYTYARQLLHEHQLGPTFQWIDRRLAADFASPAVGWGLFHDAPNRLFGLHPGERASCDVGFLGCVRQNRAAVLEQTFDEQWKVDSEAALLRESYERRFEDGSPGQEDARLLPVLALNATLTGGEARAVISPVDLGSWPRADADDPERGDDRLPLAGTVEVRDALCETNDLRLSTAALLAARFPYVTPSGRIPDRCGNGGEQPADQEAMCALEASTRCEGHFVDGGYADNSGLFTLVAVWPSLRALIVEYNARARAMGRREIAPLIIELDNHYQASIEASVPSGGLGAESLLPVQTGFGGRRAQETFARAAAYRILPDSCTVTISPSLHPGVIAPLGWELSRSAREDLRAGLVRPHPGDADATRAALRLRRLQARLAADSERPLFIDPQLEKCLPTQRSVGAE
jgi:hypothetical protein